MCLPSTRIPLSTYVYWVHCTQRTSTDKNSKNPIQEPNRIFSLKRLVVVEMDLGVCDRFRPSLLRTFEFCRFFPTLSLNFQPQLSTISRLSGRELRLRVETESRKKAAKFKCSKQSWSKAITHS